MVKESQTKQFFFARAILGLEIHQAGKTMEQVIMNAIIQHVQDNQRIRPSQAGFGKGRSCMTNLVFFYDQVTCLVDEGKTVDVVYTD